MGVYTKQELVKRFFKVFSVYGFKSITVDDLANELGMSKKTLYQYFQSKEEIVENVLLYFLSELKDIISETKESTLDVIPRLLNHYGTLIKLFNNINSVFFNSLRFFNPKIINHITKFESEYYSPALQSIFLEGVDKGVFRNDIDIEILLLSHNNLFSLFLNHQEQNGIYIKLDGSRLSNLIINEIRGMTTLLGYKVLEKHIKKSGKETKIIL